MPQSRPSGLDDCDTRDVMLGLSTKPSESIPLRSCGCNVYMKLYILGCGDAFGSGGRHQSGYLFQASDRLFSPRLRTYDTFGNETSGFRSTPLDIVFLSHLHGDHCAGLPFFSSIIFTEVPAAGHCRSPVRPEPRRRSLNSSG